MRDERTFSKRMQVYAYTSVSSMLIALLMGVGWLYKVNKINSTDSILLFILAQVLGLWVGMSNKIYRIMSMEQKTPSD